MSKDTWTKQFTALLTMSYYNFHDEISPLSLLFVSFALILFVGILQGPRVDMHVWETNGINNCNVNDTTNNKKQVNKT